MLLTAAGAAEPVSQPDRDQPSRDPGPDTDPDREAPRPDPGAPERTDVGQ